jgi:hypothetical protein
MTIKYHDTEAKAFYTKSDYDLATHYTVDAAQVIIGVDVYVNKNNVIVGDGHRDKACYFSGDGGLHARRLNGIQFGDRLYWVGSEAGHNLSSSDQIGFRFTCDVQKLEPAPQPAVRGYNGAMKFLEQVMADNDVLTVEERLKAAEIYLQYKGIPERELRGAGNAAPPTTNIYDAPQVEYAMEIRYREVRGERFVQAIWPVDGNTIYRANSRPDKVRCLGVSAEKWDDQKHHWVQVIDGKPVQTFAKDEIVFLTPNKHHIC